MKRTIGIRAACVAGMIAALGAARQPARGAAAAAPTLQFSVTAHTGMPFSGIFWTGAAFVYTLEGHSQLYTSGPDATKLRPFARVPRNGGEMRCAVSPGTHGWPAGTLYCHASQGPIYRIAADGAAVAQFATIPTPRPADGALTFDTDGRFGYALLAATGGSDSGSGGELYAVTPGGATRHIGHYGGPGGAENIAIAPAGFGSAAGQVLITIDKHDHLGRLLAMDPRGSVRTLVGGLAWGLDPITPLSTSAAPAPVRTGLYVVDWLSHDVLFASAASLRPYLGDIFLATERHGYMYVIHPIGRTYTTIPVHTNLRARDYNLEGAQFLAS